MVVGWAANVFLPSYMTCSSQVPVSIGEAPAVTVCLLLFFSTPLVANEYAERAVDAPVIRQLFSSSPRDPRYHMLSYISHKFSQDLPTHINEPRAALFLNRFSRTLAIMYATNGLADVLGISADQLIGKSFYFCIQENCLREAVKCLESAKANDSIAYLRFWFRDPTQDSRQNSTRQDEDDHVTDGNSSGDEDDGGVHLSELMDHAGNENAMISDSSNSMRSSSEPQYPQSLDPNSRSSSGNSTDLNGNRDPIFDTPANGQSRTSSISTPDGAQSSSQSWSPEQSQIELEAVVSCTSDGLVVVLRRAKPFVPHIATAVPDTTKPRYANGFFASPWANEPIIPDPQDRANPLPDAVRPNRFPIHPTAAQANTAATKGPASEDFMNSIREVAVFAWSLTGINGSLEKYGRGTPSGESFPPDGYQVWDPSSTAGPEVQTSIERVSNGYNYSPINGVPIDRKLPDNSRLVSDHQNHANLEHAYTSAAPANEFYEPSNNIEPYRGTSTHHEPNQIGRYDNTSFTNSYGIKTQDLGNGGHQNGDNGQSTETQHMDGVEHSQNTAYDTVQKAASLQNARRQDQTSPAANNQGQSNAFAKRIENTDYDPYATDNYQAPGSANYTSFQEPHPGSRWHVNNIAQQRSNGYGH